MDLDRMWSVFTSLSPRFLERYIAYHHFRSIGWVPKTGLKFGTDFGRCVLCVCITCGFRGGTPEIWLN